MVKREVTVRIATIQKESEAKVNVWLQNMSQRESERIKTENEELIMT